MMTELPAAFQGYAIDRHMGIYHRVCTKCPDYRLAIAEAKQHGHLVRECLCPTHTFEQINKRLGEPDE